MPQQNKKWTAGEEAALREGIARHGAGRWHLIKHDPQLKSALAKRSNIDLKDKHRNMRLAAIKRKTMADTPCMPGEAAFGLSQPQQAFNLRHSHYLPYANGEGQAASQRSASVVVMPPLQWQEHPASLQPMRYASMPTQTAHDSTGFGRASGKEPSSSGDSDGLQRLSAAAAALDTLQQRCLGPHQVGGMATVSGGHISGDVSRNVSRSGSGKSASSWEDASSFARSSAPSAFSRPCSAWGNAGGAGALVVPVPSGVPASVFGRVAAASCSPGEASRKKGRGRLRQTSGSWASGEPSQPSRPLSPATKALSSGSAFTRWSSAAAAPGWAGGSRSAMSMPSPLRPEVDMTAQQRGGSEASAIEWSTFEVAAEAAVAAERARRRAAGPGAKTPSRGPSPDSPFHPFAAVAAQNAAREAAAIVTLPAPKRDCALSPPVANPFAMAAGSRGASPTLPSPLLVAEAGGFGSVAPSDIPQVFPGSVVRGGKPHPVGDVASPQQAAAVNASSADCVTDGALSGCDAAKLGRVLRAACAQLDAATAGAAVRAGADCNAADSFTGRTPLHELAAAAAAAEVLGPSRGAAAGFILNMLLHADVKANVCDAAGMTPAQLAAGSAFAALIPTAAVGAIATCSGRPCSRPGTPLTPTAPGDDANIPVGMARADGSRSAPPPLAAQQNAWQTFQRRSLDGNLERRASTESRSASPLESLADGFDGSPRPRQRRSLDVNRLHQSNDPSHRQRLDGRFGCSNSLRGRSTSQSAPLPPHPAATRTSAAAVPTIAFSSSFATATARVVTAHAPIMPAAGSSSPATAGARIISGRGWPCSGASPSSRSTSAAAVVPLQGQAPAQPAALATVASISCSGVPDIAALCSSFGAAGGGGPVASSSRHQAAAAVQDVPQLLALATQALDVLAMHQRTA